MSRNGSFKALLWRFMSAYKPRFTHVPEGKSVTELLQQKKLKRNGNLTPLLYTKLPTYLITKIYLVASFFMVWFHFLLLIFQYPIALRV